MTTFFDITFDFRTDTPPNKDPDKHSPTLRRYHQLLWSKPLPSGQFFNLTTEAPSYLTHRSSGITIHLSSDAITTRMRGRAKDAIADIPSRRLPEDLGYTIGSSILFPSNKVDGSMTLNGARGFHPRIADRFDLTLECIRRHYSREDSPLSEHLRRYSNFFTLFETFQDYVEFFLLQDLVAGDGRSILFMHKFDNFSTPAVPRTAGEYIKYVTASNSFIRARNQRIEAFISSRQKH